MKHLMEKAYPKPEPVGKDVINAKANRAFEVIDATLLEKSKPYWRKSNGFSPSATNECARRFTYLLEGVEIKPDVGEQLRRIFDNGDDVHSRIVRYFEQSAILVEAERRLLTEGVPISGYIDAIIQVDGMQFIVEIKSINERGFDARKNMRRPKDDHYKQIQLYMWGTGIHQGIVWYENKNTQAWLPLVVTYNEEYVTPIIERYGRIYALHLKGEIPKRPHRQNTKICQGCDVKDRCWSDDREGTEKL